ncbi:MAG: PhzF family phenazine biosynthesis protein [Thermodesulfobacteriota bacterium]
MKKTIKLPLFQIDAFADEPFTGNAAAVCPLEAWLPDVTMQAIAAENNLSETAFFAPEGNGFRIRWFTPTLEVPLCGHATLAAAWCIFNELGYDKERINFQSQSGPLVVERQKNLIVLDFPADPPVPCEPPEALVEAFGGVRPVECLKAMDYMAVFKDEDKVAGAEPDLEALKKLGLRGVIITARSEEGEGCGAGDGAGEKYDFVSRFFAPKYGINEDPVTGSAYTQLAPYWAVKTGRGKLASRQLSPRGGRVICELKGERVLIAGKAQKYMEGTIEVKTP